MKLSGITADTGFLIGLERHKQRAVDLHGGRRIALQIGDDLAQARLGVVGLADAGYYAGQQEGPWIGFTLEEELKFLS